MIDKLVLTKEETEKVVHECLAKYHDAHKTERAVSLATVKKVVGYIEKNSRESLDYYSPDKAVRERCIPKKVWQEIKKSLEEADEIQK